MRWRRVLSSLWMISFIFLMLRVCVSYAEARPTANGNDSPRPLVPVRVKRFACAMHPEVQSERPGKCPICGMDLVLLEGEVRLPGKVSIPAGKLRDFCGGYLETRLRSMRKDSSDSTLLVDAWGALRGKEGLPLLRSLVQSENLSAAGRAARHLGLMGDKESIPRLKKLLERTPLPPDSPVDSRILEGHLGALDGLYVMDAPEAWQEIERSLNGAYSYWIIGTLSLRDSPRARKILNEFLVKNPQAPQRYATVEALARLGEKQAIQEMVGLLSSREPDLRQKSLGILLDSFEHLDQGELSKVRADFDSISNPIFERLLAATILSRAGDQEALGFILDVCDSHEHVAAASAVVSFGLAGRPENLGKLETMIQERPELRNEAVWAVSQIIARNEQ